MSRVLKFRVWSYEDKEYRTDCNLTQVFNSMTGMPATVYSDEGDRFDIEQYTGLKDKNGKEIYEGDIVKYLSFRKDYIGRIVFDFVDDSEGYYIQKHYGWGIYRDGYNTSLGDYADDNMRCDVEVIGNIHENPELSEVHK